MGQVSDTAFVISAYRANQEKISQDPYAKLWVTPQSIALAKKINKISPYEELVHSLRNRYFLDSINSFFSNRPQGTLINLGAGFSNYPYLIDLPIDFVEVDQNSVIQFKEAKSKKLQAQQSLPKRQVRYIEGNLGEVNEIASTFVRLEELRCPSPKMILMEGVALFLPLDSLKKIIEQSHSLLSVGDLFFVNTYNTDVQGQQEYHRLSRFFRDFLTPDFKATLIEDSFFQSLSGFSLIRSLNYSDLIERYNVRENVHDPKRIMQETFYELKKV